MTVEIIEHTWNRRTARYEESVEKEFAALGLAVVWRRLWSEALRQMIEEARAAAGASFDENAFVERMREEERRGEEAEG